MEQCKKCDTMTTRKSSTGLCTSCEILAEENEVINMRAKAALHDELVKAMEKILARVERNDGCKAYIHELVTALLAKAKETGNV